jgi:hypothetical protein
LAKSVWDFSPIAQGNVIASVILRPYIVLPTPCLWDQGGKIATVGKEKLGEHLFQTIEHIFNI